MMLHIDGSKHARLGPAQEQQDLITLMDDATSRVYYAQLVEGESTASVMTALLSTGLLISPPSGR